VTASNGGDSSPVPDDLSDMDWTWEDLSLTDGAFQSGSSTNRVQGRFYGPNHEEVGGAFERNQVLDAFGAARQSQ